MEVEANVDADDDLISALDSSNFFDASALVPDMDPAASGSFLAMLDNTTPATKTKKTPKNDPKADPKTEPPIVDVTTEKAKSLDVMAQLSTAESEARKAILVHRNREQESRIGVKNMSLCTSSGFGCHSAIVRSPNPTYTLPPPLFRPDYFV